MEDGTSVTRRAMLAGTSTGITGALAGCVDTLWSRAENPSPNQVSLTIKAVPADDDVLSAKIASRLRENFETVGIDAGFEPITKAELHRDILINGEYDVFVVRYPGLDEYDDLRGLLHSQYVSEAGWQNPFHFSDVTADELLESQLTAEGTAREQTLLELFDHLSETVPFTVVAFPELIGAVRNDFELTSPPRTGLDYVELFSTEQDDGPRDEPLEVGVFGEGLATRLNPIAVDRNRVPGLMELVYDPLVVRLDDELVPWLAEEVEWDDSTPPRATVTLHEGLQWHDGEPIDADDIVFTHRLLQDTSLGESESTIPAPRYRVQQTVVEGVETVDERTVEFSFRAAIRSVAVRALQIPLLPAHVWEPRAEVVGERQTQALADDNEEPIGSGLFVVDDVTDDAEVELALFEEHVLFEETSDRPSTLEAFPQFDGLRFQIAPNAGALVELLTDGEIDLTGSPVPAEQTGPILEDSDSIVITKPTSECYMIGYNAQHPDLGNPNFRRVLSRLLDREYAAEELFSGFAEPALTRSSLFGITDTELGTDETGLTEFPGSDGELDSERARELFRAENYRYEDGVLLE
jgi:peptide/nickel transport system substrate-binding protein